MSEILVRVISDDGSEVLMPASASAAEEEVGFGETIAIKASDLIEGVKPVLATVRDTLEQMAPDELKVKAKIGVAVESGAAISLIANGKTDFGIEVELIWRRASGTNGLT